MLADAMRMRAFEAALGNDGRITRDVHVVRSGAASLEEIAAELMRRFPQRFRNDGDALAFVRERSRKFG